ncbi:MAG: hypothetical protein VW230_07160, partial [Candidatus Poseidoniales archaeon]
PTTIQEFLKYGFVDEFYLVLSEESHSEPFFSGIDEQALTKSGLAKLKTLNWGIEEVHYFRKR